MLRPREATTLKLYPLRFAPVFQERVWGGRRLARYFPALPPGAIGEAWVLSGHPAGPTVVSNGPLAGAALPALQAHYGAALLGSGRAAGAGGAFPLLFKLLAAEDDLSVQVHPGDGDPDLPPGELGKSEMWVVLDAEPGARVVYGLRAGVGPDDFAAAIQAGRTMDALHELAVQAGDVLDIPAGTVHALGRGLLVAEIQQSSDTTFRIYDYDRPGLDGKPRQLHVPQALRVAHYAAPPRPVHPARLGRNRWVTLCRSPYFVVAQGRCAGEWAQATTPQSCVMLLVLSGSGRLVWPEGEEPLQPGAACLVPASLGAYRLTGDLQALQVTLP